MQKEVIPSAATAKAATSKTTATATTAAARKTKNGGGEGSKKVGREMGLLRPRYIGQCSPLCALLLLATSYTRLRALICISLTEYKIVFQHLFDIFNDNFNNSAHLNADRVFQQMKIVRRYS